MFRNSFIVESRISKCSVSCEL